MDWIIKKASVLSTEEKELLGIIGIPDNWPIEAYPYTGTIPDLFEQISDENLAILKGNNKAQYDAWLYSKMPLPPQPAPLLVELSEPKSAENIPLFKQIYSDSSKIFKSRSFVFTTGEYGSLVNHDSDGNDIGDGDLLFFDSNRALMFKGENESVEDFQTRLDSNCRYTHIYFTHPTDFGIAKGRFMYKGSPLGKFRNWLEFAPHIPKAYGGSVACLDGAFPLDMMNPGVFYEMDGCSCLIITIDETYYSHRIGHKIEHEIGDRLKICSIFDIYV